MKLSELVKIKTILDSLFLSEYETVFNNNFDSIVEQVSFDDKVNHDLIFALKASKESINSEFGNVRKNIKLYYDYIQYEIEQQQDEYYQTSLEIYQSGINDTAEYILNRRKNTKIFKVEENKELFLSRVGYYNNWKYPAIELRPAHGEVTDFIKGCDPLYLCDTDEQLLAEVKQCWNTAYQRRLRYYVIDEQDEKPLTALPNDQFGLILAVDFFNFKPMDVIEKYLKDCYDKLRPGGVVVFTFNNCDRSYAVKNVEKKFCCYTPGKKVEEVIKNVGYKVLKSFDKLENISWLEIQKPGEITTIRGGQTLGEIHTFN